MSHIQIYDTTLRDGAQGEGVNFSLQDKLLIARRLDEFGFDFVEGGYPLSNPKDAEFFQRLAAEPLRQSRLCAFGMTRRKGVRPADDPGMRALLESQAPVVTIVGKTHDFHVTEVLRVSLEENLAMIRETIAYLREAGREVIYDAEHFFDGWKANPQYARQTIRAAVEGGASIVVMCDTNGGTMPDEVAALTKEAAAAAGTLSSGSVPLGIHTHNDCDVAVANSLAAVAAGATHVQGTINGLGERCGNADLVSVIANLALKKKGYEVLGGNGAEHLTELSRYVYEVANMHFRNNQPFVGPSAFAHKGGMHTHAVARASKSYEHIAPEAVGNERRILVGELSGRATIQFKLSGNLTDGSKKLVATQESAGSKISLEQEAALMEKVLQQVVELENRGYQFEAAEASFELLVRRAAGSFKPHFELLHYHVGVETDASGETTTEATVKLRVAGEVRHEVAEGDGPVNALDAALRKALNGHFPNLRVVQLVDYKVRVINSDAGTAAAVRVVIESQDADGKTWGTVGVNENVIKASWDALVDSIEYKLCKDEG
jgi:2-isopropylmalate synthase